MDRIQIKYADGRVEVLDLTNSDRVKFDLQRAKSGWPPATEAPFLAQTYMAWTAARRNGYTGAWAQFSEEDAVQVEFLADEDEDATAP